MSKEARIGMLLVGSVLLLVLGINFLKGNHLFSSSRVYYGIYDKVEGLKTSNPVVYSGMKIGQVREISFAENNPRKIAVTFVIDNNKFSFSKDSKAMIESTLMGEVSIVILPGESNQLAESGDTLQVHVAQGFTQAVYDEIEPIKAKALELISSVDSLLELTRSILDEDARPHLTEGFASMSKGLKALENSAYKLDGLMASERDKLSTIFTNLQTITDAFADNSGSLSSIIQNFSQISDSLAKSNLAEVVQNAGDAVTNVAEIMDKINKGNGTMSMLLNNDSLHNSLVNSTDQLANLLEDMKANPKRYVHFSVFGKKEKQLKLTKKESERLQKLLSKPIKD